MEEWDYEKNEELGLTPDNVSYGNTKKVWWLLPYDDPKTGKHFNFEWQAATNDRTRGIGCPFLSGQAIWQGFNDLATVSPLLTKEWHPTKNGDLKPTDITICSGKKVWWFLPYDDPDTGKHFDFEWNATIASRASGINCPYLSNKAVWTGFNDLATINPELAAEWHPTKNRDLKPTGVAAGSNEKVWWLCNLCGEEWFARISDRKKNRGCPHCNCKGVSFPEFAIYYYLLKIYPDIKHKYTDLGFELDIYIPSLNTGIEYDGSYWHKDKLEIDNKKDQLCKNNNIRLIRLRGNLLPQTVSAETINIEEKNNKSLGDGILELLKFLNVSYDFKINIELDYNKIVSMKKSKNKENNITITHPELAAEWHPTKNGNLKPDQFSYGSNLKVWWYLPYDDPITGKHFEFEWQATIYHRINSSSCPYLSGHAVWQGFNDLATTHPELTAEWHPTKNGDLKPTDVTAGSSKKVWWKCPNCGYEWQAVIKKLSKSKRCSMCDGRLPWTEEEIKIMAEYYETEGAAIINRLPNKTLSAIHGKSSSLGLKYNNPRSWTNREINILKENYSTLYYNIPELLETRSIHSIKSKANRLGLKHQVNNKKIKLKGADSNE